MAMNWSFLAGFATGIVFFICARRLIQRHSDAARWWLHLKGW